MFRGMKKAQQYLGGSPGACRSYRREVGTSRAAPARRSGRGGTQGPEAPTDGCFILSERRGSGGRPAPVTVHRARGNLPRTGQDLTQGRVIVLSRNQGFWPGN